MTRRILLTAALLAGPASAALAADAAAPAPGGDVIVTNKCCSIWDFLGVQQACDFIDQNLVKPVTNALRLTPLTSDTFANEPGAMGLASKLKKEEKKAPLKVKAIRYLATLDCNCYPEVVDTLLASLDDCCEVVRYEALKALNNKCRSNCFGCKKCRVKKSIYSKKGSCDTCKTENCCGCQCQKKVVNRLNDLLLERDETGCLKEKSVRVRELATAMIEECLSCLQPPPEMCEESAPQEQVKPRPDPLPKARPDQPAKAKPDTASAERVPFYQKWQSGKAELGVPVVAQPASLQIVESAPTSIPAASTEYAEAQAPVIIDQSVKRGGRKHLFGELFGY